MAGNRPQAALRIESEPMKPAHAAALALVVWYLMLPPSKTPKPDVPTLLAPIFFADVSAPLSRWTKLGAFPTQQKCEAHRAAEPRARRPVEQCARDDDPRLKEK